MLWTLLASCPRLNSRTLLLEMLELQMAEQLTHTHTHTHTNTHTQTHTHTCTNTHAHMHLYTHTFSGSQDDDTSPAPVELKAHPAPDHRLHFAEQLLPLLPHCEDNSAVPASTERLACTSSWLLEVQQLQQMRQQQGSGDWGEADQIHSLGLEGDEAGGDVSPAAPSVYLSIDGMQCVANVLLCFAMCC